MHSDIVISQSDGRPMYLQIVEQIKQHVSVGDWVSGQEIPSIRQLAVALCVSVITVKRAYLELEREGVIVTQHGKGSMVASNPALTPHFYEQELAEHVEQAARLGDLLGLSPEELGSRVTDTAARLIEHRPAKEIV
jgi:GntR family transcriptional regulator